MTDRPRWLLATVRARTTAAACAAVGVVVSAGAVLVVVILHHSMLAGLESQLRVRADDVTVQARRGPLPERLAGGGEDGTLVQVIDATGVVVARTDGTPGARPLAAFVPAGRRELAGNVTRPGLGDGSPYRVLARRAATPSGEVVVYAAGTLDPTHDSVRTLVVLLATGVPAVVVLVGVVAWVLVGRALGPVERIRGQVAEITAQRLGRRIAEPPVMDEIGRLARTMNETLERLDVSDRKQRALVSDTSHELRSPLASVRTMLEVAARHPDGTDRRQLLASLLKQHLRLEALVDDLLVLAHCDEGQPARGEPVDLDELVVAEVASIRARGGLRVDVTGVSGGRVAGDQRALSRVVRNLLANAERHARTTITVGLTQRADGVELVVADDGGGVHVDDRDRIFERFARTDEGRSRDAGGAGLGLAIVHEVVTSHGGTVGVTGPPPPAGAVFVVTLPY